MHRLFLLLILYLLTAPARPQAADAGKAAYDEGQKALAAGNYAEAERQFERARKADPGVAEIHANLGLIHFQEGRFAEAIKNLQEALRLNPSLPKLRGLLAMSRSELGQFQEALPDLESCYRESAEPPIKRMCGLQLERAYSGLQRGGDAVELALELQKQFPRDPEILYENERIYGSYAFQTVQQLVAVAPDSVWRHQAAGEANESQGAYQVALGEYQQVLRVDPGRPGIHYRIGRTLLARWRDTHDPADNQHAQTEFQAELKLDPANANAAYELGETARQGGQLEKAEQYFSQAIEAHPDFEQAQLGLARVEMAQGKIPQALPHLQTAVQLNEGDEVAWYQLAQAERSVGNTAEQKKALGVFQKLHAEQAQRENAAPSEVTRQTLDGSAQP